MIFLSGVRLSQTVLAFLLLSASFLAVSPFTVLAKGGADNVSGTPFYSVGITSATMADTVLTLTGRATIQNFKGKENVQFVKFSWGDGETEIVKASTLPSYYKSSSSISIPAWTKSHTYALNGEYTITVTVYRGNSSGGEAYPAERASVTIQTENSLARCMDGIDNDRDLKKDLIDSDCEAFKMPETTLELCSDGFDNDLNGFTDLYDPSCQAFAPPENTEETCSDGIDNNFNGKIDLADESCAEFRPTETTLEMCRDGLDNDFDGKVDGRDSDCYEYNEAEDDEITCTDGIDNDYNGIFDRQEGLCIPFFMVRWF